MTDTETIEHLREITIRQAERIEQLEGELIKERAHSRRLSEIIWDAREERFPAFTRVSLDKASPMAKAAFRRLTEQ